MLNGSDDLWYWFLYHSRPFNDKFLTGKWYSCVRMLIHVHSLLQKLETISDLRLITGSIAVPYDAVYRDTEALARVISKRENAVDPKSINLFQPMYVIICNLYLWRTMSPVELLIAPRMALGSYYRYGIT